MTPTDKRVDFFRAIAFLIGQLDSEGIKMMPTCFHRTSDEQLTLYNQGKTKVLHSKHQDWLAIDLVLVKDGELVWERTPEYEKAGERWEMVGGVWGGRWKSLNDIYHFEASNEKGGEVKGG